MVRPASAPSSRSTKGGKKRSGHWRAGKSKEVGLFELDLVVEKIIRDETKLDPSWSGMQEVANRSR